MQKFEFFQKTDYILERSAEDNCGQLIRQRGARSVLVLYGRKYAPQSGVLERISRSLDRAGLERCELGGVISNPKAETVRRGIALCEAQQVDFVLAVGGGSVIDTAKAIAAGMYLAGDIWELFEGRKTIHRALSVGVILTFLGSGSECSPCAVLNDVDAAGKRVRRVIRSELLVPAFCLLNPELTFTLSNKATANGAIAMLCCLLSHYLPEENGMAAAPRVIEALMSAILNALRRCQADPFDYEARADLMWAEMMTYSGLLLGSSADLRAWTLEYALSDYRDKPYGNALSLIMPAFLIFAHHDNLKRLAQFSHNVLGVSLHFEDLKRTVKEGIRAWYCLMHEFALPTKLADLNLSAQDIPKICALIPEDDKTGLFVGFDKASCEAIYTLALFNDLDPI